MPVMFASQPMLPVAFDALVDVMTTKVTPGRLEKERAVVLSGQTAPFIAIGR